MGLLANWEYPREEKSPFYTERGGETIGVKGISRPVLINALGGGGGVWALFYTVPSGYKFLLKSVRSYSDIRVNGITIGFTTFSAANEYDFEQPIEYPAGTTFYYQNGGTAAQLVQLYGIEETEEINRERNTI